MLPITLFTYGFLAACAGLLLQILLLSLFGTETTLTSPSLIFLLSAASIEELAKLLFLVQALRRFGSQALNLAQLILFGLGFATLELGFVFFQSPHSLPSLPLLGLNAFLHIGTSVILGMALGRLAKPLVLIVLIGVTLLHGLYNFYRL